MKKLLRYLLELRFLPGVSSFLFDNETWLRLLPLRRFFRVADPGKNQRIIDVGGGTGRLELALKRTDVLIYDLSSESIGIAQKNFPQTRVGSGAGIDFPDDSFDWAISVHTLEHVPKSEREKFLLEMIRVAEKGVYLNFPEGEHAELLCRNFLAALDKKGMEPNPWTIEHLETGLPLLDDILAILKKQDKFIFKYRFIRNYKAENAYWTKQRTAGPLKSYFLSPWLSLQKLSRYNKLPGVEILLAGARDEATLEKILRVG